jgi:hypothetical protein
MPTADETSKILGASGPDIVPASAPFGSCPLPIFDHNRIVLGHGSGGKLTADLIEKIFLPAFRNPTLDKMDDQAVLRIGICALPSPRTRLSSRRSFFPAGTSAGSQSTEP